MNFHPVKFHNGTVVCAGDTPSFTVSFENTDDVYPGRAAMNTPPNYVVQCSYYCTATKTSDDSDACIGFNFQPQFERCDFYSDVPKIWTSRLPCIYYEASADIKQDWYCKLCSVSRWCWTRNRSVAWTNIWTVLYRPIYQNETKFFALNCLQTIHLCRKISITLYCMDSAVDFSTISIWQR